MCDLARFVTKIRNVVERLFAVLKRFRILRYVHSNNYLPLKIHQIFTIICSLHNAFGNPLYKDNGESMENDVIEMRRRQQLENDIAESEAVDTGWTGGSRDKFEELEFIPDFDLSDVRKLACGPYVLSLAARYFNHAKKVIYRYHPDHPHSIQVTGIISRHSKNDENVKGYTVYIRFVDDGRFQDTISYCKCKVGTRTAGLCSHEAAALYMLYHWFNEIPIPRKHMYSKQEKHLAQFIDTTWYQGASITLLSDTIGTNEPIEEELVESEENEKLDECDDEEVEQSGDDDSDLDRSSVEEKEEKNDGTVLWDLNDHSGDENIVPCTNNDHKRSNTNRHERRSVRNNRKRPLLEIIDNHNHNRCPYNLRNRSKRQKTNP